MAKQKKPTVDKTVIPDKQQDSLKIKGTLEGVINAAFKKPSPKK